MVKTELIRLRLCGAIRMERTTKEKSVKTLNVSLDLIDHLWDEAQRCVCGMWDISTSLFQSLRLKYS